MDNVVIVGVILTVIGVLFWRNVHVYRDPEPIVEGRDRFGRKTKEAPKPKQFNLKLLLLVLSIVSTTSFFASVFFNTSHSVFVYALITPVLFVSSLLFVHSYFRTP